MTDKQPMQASGEDAGAGTPDGVNTGGGREGGGQDGGGAFKDDQTSSDGGEGGFMGHGGQSEIGYHGSGKPAGKGDADADDRNAATDA
jgi:hypothetical protein